MGLTTSRGVSTATGHTLAAGVRPLTFKYLRGKKLPVTHARWLDIHLTTMRQIHSYVCVYVYLSHLYLYKFINLYYLMNGIQYKALT